MITRGVYRWESNIGLHLTVNLIVWLGNQTKIVGGGMFLYLGERVVNMENRIDTLGFRNTNDMENMLFPISLTNLLLLALLLWKISKLFE